MEGEAHCNAVTLVPDEQIFLFSPFWVKVKYSVIYWREGALCRGIFGHGNRINPRQSLIKSVTTSTTFSQSRHSQGTRSIQRRAIPRMADQPQWRQSQGTRTIPRNQGSPKETGQSQGSREIPRSQVNPKEGNPKDPDQYQGTREFPMKAIPRRAIPRETIPRMADPLNQTQSTEKLHFMQLPQKWWVVNFKMGSNLTNINWDSFCSASMQNEKGHICGWIVSVYWITYLSISYIG